MVTPIPKNFNSASEASRKYFGSLMEDHAEFASWRQVIHYPLDSLEQSHSRPIVVVKHRRFAVPGGPPYVSPVTLSVHVLWEQPTNLANIWEETIKDKTRCWLVVSKIFHECWFLQSYLAWSSQLTSIWEKEACGFNMVQQFSRVNFSRTPIHWMAYVLPKSWCVQR